MPKHHVLDMEKVKDSALHWSKDTIPSMQLAVHVMCGGGLLGRFAAEQPADFYIDSRVARLPYSKAAITQAVRCLVAFAETYGLDPHNLPTLPSFHNMGIL